MFGEKSFFRLSLINVLLELGQRFGPAISNEKGIEMSELKELINFMSKALVDNVDNVEVREVVGEQTTVYELKVDKSDLGKVIGKQGRTARALRTILNAASTKLKKRSVLEIIE